MSASSVTAIDPLTIGRTHRRTPLAATAVLQQLVDAAYPGVRLDAPGRQVALIEAVPSWSYDAGTRHHVARLVDLATLESWDDSDGTLYHAPSEPGVALVLVDRHMGTDGNVAIVLPAGAIDDAALLVAVDARLEGEAVPAELTAATGDRLLLALAETRAAELAARQREAA